MSSYSTFDATEGEAQTVRSIHDSINFLFDDDTPIKDCSSPAHDFSASIVDVASQKTKSSKKSVSFGKEASHVVSGSLQNSGHVVSGSLHSTGTDKMSICRIATDEWFADEYQMPWQPEFALQASDLSALPPLAIPSKAQCVSFSVSSPETGCSTCPETVTSPQSAFNLSLDHLVEAPKPLGVTTLMIRNIPNRYTRDMMLQELQSAGMGGKFDFFYLPIDFQHQNNVGYAFINLICEEYATELRKKFNGVKLTKVKSGKVCVVSAAKTQGMMANAALYRHSMIRTVKQKFQPMFFKDGKEIAFPSEVPDFTYNYFGAMHPGMYEVSSPLPCHMMNTTNTFDEHFGTTPRINE